MAETWRATAKAQTRERMLKAAGHLFAERGYHAVSIGDLGASVGVTGPALYRHFSNKEAILIELLVSSSERLLVGYERTIAQGASDLESLRNLIAFHVDFSLAERDIIRIQDRELANLPAQANRRVRQLQRRYLRGWQDIAGRLRPELNDAELEVRMHALFGVLNSTPHNSSLESSTDIGATLALVALAVIFSPMNRC